MLGSIHRVLSRSLINTTAMDVYMPSLNLKELKTPSPLQYHTYTEDNGHMCRALIPSFVSLTSS